MQDQRFAHLHFVVVVVTAVGVAVVVVVVVVVVGYVVVVVAGHVAGHAAGHVVVGRVVLVIASVDVVVECIDFRAPAHTCTVSVSKVNLS